MVLYPSYELGRKIYLCSGQFNSIRNKLTVGSYRNDMRGIHKPDVLGHGDGLGYTGKINEDTEIRHGGHLC